MDEKKGDSGKWTEDSIMDALSDGVAHIPKKSDLYEDSPALGDEKNTFQKSILGKVLEQEEAEIEDAHRVSTKDRTTAARAPRPRKRVETETYGDKAKGGSTSSPQILIACIGAFILLIICFLVIRTNKYIAENEKLTEELGKQTSTHDEYEKMKLDYNKLEEDYDTVKGDLSDLQEKYDGLEFEYQAYKANNGQEQSSAESSDDNQVYIVKKGETLSIISNRLFGSSKYWPNIMAENNIIDDKSIWPGMELKIPEINTD